MVSVWFATQIHPRHKLDSSLKRLNVMSGPNHPTIFSGDWSDNSSWAEIPASKPQVSVQPELEALPDDTLFEPDVLPQKGYAQGDTIGIVSLSMRIVGKLSLMWA